MNNSYVNNSQQILLRVIDALAVEPLQPKSLAVLIELTAASRDQVFRTLQNLKQAGWAEQQGEAWLLSPHICQLSERMRFAINNLHLQYLTFKSYQGVAQ